jgi:hypothetical protein
VYGDDTAEAAMTQALLPWACLVPAAVLRRLFADAALHRSQVHTKSTSCRSWPSSLRLVGLRCVTRSVVRLLCFAHTQMSSLAGAACHGSVAPAAARRCSPTA